MSGNVASGIILSVHIIPGARKNEILSAREGETVHIKIKAPPVEGKANDELVDYLHEILKVRKSQIEILSGQTSREKRVRILGISPAELFQYLIEQCKE
jgi:uncharacterized protein